MSNKTTAIEQLRNIGLIAHIDAGKTTTTERILYYAGRTHQLGSVDDGTTVTDWMEQERERGITIVDASVTAYWREHQLNIIDTPGHIDFTAEVQRALRVLDGAVVVFDALQGVEPQSETVWRQADRYGVPRLCFINKMDRIGANFSRAVASIRERLSANPVTLQLPIGAENDFNSVVDLITLQQVRWSDALGASREYMEIPEATQDKVRTARAEMIEKVAEQDDELLGDWLEGVEPSESQLRAAIRRATLANRLVPVLCGTALRNKGVQPVLDAVVDYLPSPLDVGVVEGSHPKTTQPVPCPPQADAPLSALLFKTVTDPYAGQLAYVRIYSGVLKAGSKVLNARLDRAERVGRLERMYAARREHLDEVRAGDIAAILGMKHAVSGDTLCDPAHPVLLESITFPEPVIQITVAPRTADDHDRLTDALHHLAQDDPTFRSEEDETTGQTILSGMGELHLEVLLDRLRVEQGVNVLTGKPKVAYKETITRPVARAEEQFIRQSGTHNQYAHVVLAIEPIERGRGIQFENQVAEDAIPKLYHASVESGVKDACESGVIGGYPVT
ncbi:MAG: elongation factor G, partial [Gammaproteobacteria bacterium]|nr:elongation factor G [Gammaproteobacteria bacterium]